jgi:hypothetical protein
LLSLRTWRLYHTEGLDPPENPITAGVFSKAIKDTHCIKFIFTNFKQNYAMVNQNITYYTSSNSTVIWLFVMMSLSAVDQSRNFSSFHFSCSYTKVIPDAE